MKEVRRALCNASSDDSKLLLLSAVGSVFCSGLDYSYLIGKLSTDRRKESSRIAEAIRYSKGICSDLRYLIIRPILSCEWFYVLEVYHGLISASWKSWITTNMPDQGLSPFITKLMKRKSTYICYIVIESLQVFVVVVIVTMCLATTQTVDHIVHVIPKEVLSH